MSEPNSEPNNDALIALIVAKEGTHTVARPFTDRVTAQVWQVHEFSSDNRPWIQCLYVRLMRCI